MSSTFPDLKPVPYGAPFKPVFGLSGAFRECPNLALILFSAHSPTLSS